MAFKMKGMYFGEGTGSAMEKKDSGTSKEVSIPRVDWGDAGEAADLQSKMDESKNAININKDNNPDPKTVEHTPQTVKPVEDITPQTVEPVEDIKPQTIDDNRVDSEENKNSKKEEQEVEL